MAYISAQDEFLRSEQDFWPGLRTFLNATFSLTTEKSGYGIWDMVERKMFHFPSLCRGFLANIIFWEWEQFVTRSQILSTCC